MFNQMKLNAFIQKKVNQRNVIEGINIVQIPKSDQNCEDYIKAKHEELEKLRQFNTYDEVADTGQFHISISEKGGCNQSSFSSSRL